MAMKACPVMFHQGIVELVEANKGECSERTAP